MRMRTVFAITLTMFALPAVAAELPPLMPPPRELPQEADANVAYKYKLRNVAAADAALAVNTFLKGKRLTARVVAEPEFNNVVVSAAPALQKQIGDMITALDKQPAQVVVQAMVIQVPCGFAAEAGLEGDGNAWTLSPREAKMLTGLIRAAKGRGELDVLSRPQIQVAEGQTGFVRVGQDFPVETGGGVKLAGGAIKLEPKKVENVPTGFTMRLTPRVSPDGKSVQLRTEAQLTTVTSVALTQGTPGAETITHVPAFNKQEVSSTKAVRLGETLVVVMTGGETGGRSFLGAIQRQCGGAKYETLVVITPHLVRGEADHARILADEAAKMKWALPK